MLRSLRSFGSFRSFRHLASAFLLSLAAGSVAWAAQPDARASTEIEYLKTYLGASSCEFNRNGSWYPAAEAVQHIDRKYTYVKDKGMVATAEDFIRLAGTESSLSGKPYLVRCGSTAPVQSAQWLGEALTLYRKQHP